MTKAATTQKTVDGITINVPVGSLDTPSDRAKRLMKIHQDPTNWKLPTAEYVTQKHGEAQDLAHCYDFYFGGHEMKVERNSLGVFYTVTSRGYYHYIGA